VSSPLDRADRAERSLRALVVRHLSALRRRGITDPSDPAWQGVFVSLRRDTARRLRPALYRAYADAVKAVRLPVIRATVTAYADVQAPLAAKAFAESLSGDTAAAFAEALVRAGVSVAPATTASSTLGATAKQAARIAQWAERARAAGLSKRAIAEGVARQTAAAIRLRARSAADRAIAEAINGARRDAWQAQIDAGKLPVTMRKRWVTQGDQNVRPTHSAQGRAAAIPWNQPYAIMGVLHPPSDDPGCRCFEEPVVSGRERGKAQPRVPAPRTLVR
jgi:hypothetical protein